MKQVARNITQIKADQDTQTTKPSTWKCSCGYLIPKKNAKLSGSPEYALGFHVHCPQCTKPVAIFVDPQETK